MNVVRICTVGFFCLLPLAGMAQWQWIDKDGLKVYSDQAPSLDIPEKNIQRRPGASSPQAALPESTPEKSSDPDKKLEQKVRKAEASEQAARLADAQKLTRAKADNCARARQGKATLGSGMRIASINAQGEREIMDDKARAAEQSRLQSVIAGDCS